HHRARGGAALRSRRRLWAQRTHRGAAAWRAASSVAAARAGGLSMSLTIGILNAMTGLRASQTALVTISNNIANANTEGYSRKTIQFQSMQLGGLGAGVSIAEVRRETSEVLVRDALMAGSGLEQRRVKESMLSRLESLFGGVNDDDSIGAAIARFRDAMQKLAEQPENTGLQMTVVQRAQEVTALFNNIAREIQAQRLEAER